MVNTLLAILICTMTFVIVYGLTLYLMVQVVSEAHHDGRIIQQGWGYGGGYHTVLGYGVAWKDTKRIPMRTGDGYRYFGDTGLRFMRPR